MGSKPGYRGAAWPARPKAAAERRRRSEVGPHLANAIRHHFPSYDKALQAAGIDPATVRLIVPWDQAMVIAELQRRRDSGQPLSKRHVGKLYAAASRQFGSYVKALEAAGIDSREARARTRRIGHWTEELVLQTLRDLQRDGKDLRHRHMKEHNQPLFFAAKQLFGSYVNAVKQAGIDYWEMSQAQLAKERAAREASGTKAQ